ncbi:hypothetical protein LS684_04445 [Cytobacillus spongiae]|uniref:hypothetical protein n=1 Tax=Cytobacillus spongiae TaxID=2901381 RepID=UPI001F1CDC9C|nr:hypothetical protein [Cytobacillus spongiae]UII56721.1 hypothetical protein LS684_04445 [Cytobacillus spongiae]
MKVEELATKLNELEVKFEGLKDSMGIFQDNISNNISWFYSAAGIFVGLIGAVGVALYFLVQTAVNKGIEKGIEKTNKKIETLIKESEQFHWSTGTTSVMNKEFQISLPDLGSNGLISFEVRDKNGLILDQIVTVKEHSSRIGVISVKVPQLAEYSQAYWAALWIPNKFFTK